MSLILGGFPLELQQCKFRKKCYNIEDELLSPTQQSCGTAGHGSLGFPSPTLTFYSTPLPPLLPPGPSQVTKIKLKKKNEAHMVTQLLKICYPF